MELMSSSTPNLRIVPTAARCDASDPVTARRNGHDGWPATLPGCAPPRCRARHVGEEGDLAEAVASPDGSHDALANGNFEHPIGDRVELIAFVALRHHHLVGGDGDLRCRTGHGLQRQRRERGERGDLTKEADRHDRDVGDVVGNAQRPQRQQQAARRRRRRARSAPCRRLPRRSAAGRERPEQHPDSGEQLDRPEDRRDGMRRCRPLQQHAAREIEQRPAEPGERQKEERGRDRRRQPEHERRRRRSAPSEPINNGARRSLRTSTVETSALMTAPTPMLVASRPGPDSPSSSFSLASTTTIKSSDPTSTYWPPAIASTPLAPGRSRRARMLRNTRRAAPTESDASSASGDGTAGVRLERCRDRRAHEVEGGARCQHQCRALNGEQDGCDGRPAERADALASS